MMCGKMRVDFSQFLLIKDYIFVSVITTQHLIHISLNVKNKVVPAFTQVTVFQKK